MTNTELEAMARECGSVIGEDGPDEQFEVCMHRGQLRALCEAYQSATVAALQARIAELENDVLSARVGEFAGQSAAGHLGTLVDELQTRVKVLESALKDLLDGLSNDDEESLLEHVPQVAAAREALKEANHG
jgi:hypothetical protein